MLGWGLCAPKRIDGGGQASLQAWNLRWSGWGRATATATGISGVWSTGEVDGVGGDDRIQLRAMDIGKCSAHGPLAYRRLEIRSPVRIGGPLGRWRNWNRFGPPSVCRAF